jgi:pimeloyl-ACP methyl ester carboxylesterase
VNAVLRQLPGPNMAAGAMPAGRRVELPDRGTTFVYDVPGPRGAPTLLLLHGLIATAGLNWYPAIESLSRSYRVVAMDLRGSGRGIPVNGRFRFSDCADDAIVLADTLGIERVVPVGYSLGGAVAQLVWRRHPDRVSGLVLCATSRNFSGTGPERFFYASLWGAIVPLQLIGRLPLLRRPVDEVAETDASREEESGPAWALAELRHTSPAVVLQSMHAMGRFSSHEWVGRIDVPTAVVVTTRDRAISPTRQLKLANAIPGATIHPIETGHTACVLGADRFVPALEQACDSVADRIPGRRFSRLRRGKLRLA